MFEKNMMFPVLLDTYGVLLTERKREILDYYYNEDYSLSEISELTGISRQGVRDAIKKSEEEVYDLEAKLKIIEKSREQSAIVDEIIAQVACISAGTDPDTQVKLQKVIEMLNTVRTADRSDGDIQE
ncbi:MAG: DNA-binding protein [Ruminococcaceae bacterium]|nr:DNA-binding protein [Oscillospiraceae bacterium]